MPTPHTHTHTHAHRIDERTYSTVDMSKHDETLYARIRTPVASLVHDDDDDVSSPPMAFNITPPVVPVILGERSVNVNVVTPSNLAGNAGERSPKMLLLNVESRQGSTSSDWLTHLSQSAQGSFGSSPEEGTTPQAAASSRHQIRPLQTTAASPLRPFEDGQDAAAAAAAAAAEPPTPAPTTVAAAATIAAADEAAKNRADAEARADAELAAAAMAVRRGRVVLVFLIHF